MSMQHRPKMLSQLALSKMRLYTRAQLPYQYTNYMRDVLGCRRFRRIAA